MPLATCRGCSSEVEIPGYRFAKGDLICAPCVSARAAAYRARRRAAGDPVRNFVDREQKRKLDREAYARAYADPERRPRVMARVKARRAIRTGRLVRQPCEVCGVAKVEAHHDDYSQPLSVRWLCPTHHREHHAAERALRRAA